MTKSTKTIKTQSAFWKVCLVSLVMVGNGYAEEATNLIRNGTFTNGLDCWVTDHVTFDQKTRMVSADLTKNTDSWFALSQNLTIPPNLKSLEIEGSIELIAQKIPVQQPILIRIRLYDARGNSLIISSREINQSKAPQVIKIPRRYVDSIYSDHFMIEGIRGEGILIFKDAKLLLLPPK
jgi:hypothetical protein